MIPGSLLSALKVVGSFVVRIWRDSDSPTEGPTVRRPMGEQRAVERAPKGPL